MKKILAIVFFGLCTNAYSQIDTDSLIHVSNSENFKLSPFARLKIKKDKISYNFVIDVNSIGFSKYHNENVAKVIGVDEYALNTAIVFSTKTESSKHYYYPINDKKFNYNYYDKKIYPISAKKIRIKIYTTIFKTDSTHVVVIDSIKLMKKNRR